MAALNVGLAVLDLTGVGYLAKGVIGAVKVAKIFTTKGGSNTWSATRDWYAKNVNTSIPKGNHIHHWLVERQYFEGNKFLEKIFNRPWNLNPKPFENIFHNTEIHNNGFKGWLNGVPDWVKDSAKGAAALSVPSGGCGCEQ